MPILDDPALMGDADSLLDLGWFEPGPMLVLLKLLTLYLLWAVYLAKRRRFEALRRSIDIVSRRSRPHGGAPPAPADAGSVQRRRLAAEMSPRRRLMRRWARR